MSEQRPSYSEVRALDQLKVLVQSIADQHRLRIDSVRIRWLDVGTHDQPRIFVERIDAEIGTP